MRKISGITTAVLCFALMLAGCGGGGGGVTPSPTTTTTVTTRVVMPTGGGGRIAGRTAEATTVVSGATVRIITADGMTYSMSENPVGSGNYETSVSGLTGGFIIEATKGDLIMENMFTNVVPGLAYDAGETNARTTAFVEIARTMVAAMQVSGLDTSNNLGLLQSLDNAQVTLDTVELRYDVVDGQEPVYENVVSTYTAVLATANTESSSGESVLEAWAETEEYTQTVQVIENITPPVESDDKTAIHNAVASLYDAYESRNVSSLLSCLSTNYLNDGLDRDTWIVIAQQDWADMSSSVMQLISTKIEISGNSAEVWIMEYWKDLYTDGSTEESRGRWKTNYVKENGVWKWAGNQRKVGDSWAIEKMRNVSQTTWDYYASFWIEEAEAYPVESMSVSGPNLTVNPMDLQYMEDDQRWDHVSPQNRLTAPPAVGDTYILTVNFEDGSTAQYEHVVEDLPPDVSIDITSTPSFDGYYIDVPAGTSSVDLSWTATGDIEDCSAMDIGIWASGFNYYSGDQDPSTFNEISIPTTGMPSGTPLYTALAFESMNDGRSRTIYNFYIRYGE